MNPVHENLLLDHARAFVKAPLSHIFTTTEITVLKCFFSNLNNRIFFLHSLPPNIGASLLAMYSRIKNKRGLRGLFVDSFLPQLLAGFLPEVKEQFKDDVAEFVKTRGIKKLEQFIDYSPEARDIFHAFMSQATVNPEYMEELAASQKVQKFLSMWLDKYGHNSIARTASLWICCEEISILTAKSLEWPRPGAGYIELSTRYVDFKNKAIYPIIEELAICGIDTDLIQKTISRSFELYGLLAGEKVTGIFPTFLREKYADQYIGHENDLEQGVTGETFDVLGNLLPAATLTSVGIAISGESLPSLLKHLILDNLPETRIVAECIAEEAHKIGADQFVRHFEPSEWESDNWQYCMIDTFAHTLRHYRGEEAQSQVLRIDAPETNIVENILCSGFSREERFRGIKNFNEVAHYLKSLPRKDHDKLPHQFEYSTTVFDGVMSFRGWRDLHRQGLSTHQRTLLTPLLGFYRYDKPAPVELQRAFNEIAQLNMQIYRSLSAARIPQEIIQYVLALGNRVGFVFAANLRQLEFCNWQRTKWGVNHEVRQIFIDMEHLLRKMYPWWSSISRADTTPAYIFARGDEAKILKH